MNQLTSIPAERATLVDIRTDNKRFPRLYSYKREEAVGQMNIIILMAFQFRGQQADVATITQMSSSLIDILNDDEYGIGTKYLSFEEIKRVVRKSVLGQGKEMYVISVSSIFQALADYCKGEGRMADKKAKKIASRQKELKMSIIVPVLQGHTGEIMQRSRTMYESEKATNYLENPAGNQETIK